MSKRIMAVVVALGLFAPLAALAQSKSDYCYQNPAIGSAVKPNIVLMLDSSGSMGWRAYGGGYDSTRSYYGYAKPDHWYDYNGGNIQPVSACGSCTATNFPQQDGSGNYSGNYLNYVLMDRIDVARKALMGGKTSPRISNSPSSVNQYNFEDGETVDAVAGVPAQEQPSGVIQDVKDDARWGLATFGNGADGATVDVDVTNTNLTNTYTAIENWAPNGNTPLAEALWSLTGYFAQFKSASDMPDGISGDGPAYSGGDYSTNSNSDPLNYGTGGSTQFASCADSFVLYVSDGAPTADDKVPSDLQGYNDNPDTGNTHDNAFNHGDHLEDVAFYGRTNDLRPAAAGANEIDGKQNLILYPLYAFGSNSTARELLKRSAVTGGFEDQDGDGVPYHSSDCTIGTPNSDPKCAEWDEDGDGQPDTYFESQDGSQLEAKIRAAVTSILDRVQSGTAVATIPTQKRTGGSLLQAFYRPTSTESGAAGTVEVPWKGFVRSLWTDPLDNFRSDHNSNDELILDEDMIVDFFFDPAGPAVRARMFPDDGSAGGTAKDNIPDTCDVSAGSVQTVANTDVPPLWEVGKLLAARNPGTSNSSVASSERQIWFNDGSDSLVDFDATAGVASTLAPYWELGNAGTPSSEEELIKYLRGYDNPGGNTSEYRLRQADNDSSETYQGVWKLGAVINSSPKVIRDKGVSDPADPNGTYAPFTSSATVDNRDSMLFVGGNDGMLHAFRPGDVQSGGGSPTAELQGSNPGKEAWAFIPENALPYLRWYGTLDKTCLMPTVDYRVTLEAASIGANGAAGAGSSQDASDWRSLLIGTMGFGGKELQCGDIDGGGGDDWVSSSVFVLDVTDPESPDLLWERQLPDRSLALTKPVVARKASTNSNNGDWYVVLGSGPMDPAGTQFSPNPGVHVFNLRNGTRVRTLELTNSSHFRDGNNLSSADVAVGEPYALDPDQDDLTDSIFLGTYGAAGQERGKLYRLHTDDTNVANWGLSEAASVSASMNNGRPFFAAPSPSKDPFGKVWLYAGTGRFLGQADKSQTSSPHVAFGYQEPCWGDGTNDNADCASPSSVTVDNDLARMDGVTVTVGGTADKVCKCAGVQIEEFTGTCPTGADVVVQTTTGEDYSGGECGNQYSCTPQTGATGQQAFNNIKDDIRANFDGWYVQLPGDERITSRAEVSGGLVNFLGFVPSNDLCKAGGSTTFHALHYLTGTLPPNPVFLNAQGYDSGTQELSSIMDLGQGVPPAGSSLKIKQGPGGGGAGAGGGTADQPDATSNIQLCGGGAGGNHQAIGGPGANIGRTNLQGTKNGCGILFTREP
ncbi:pilus assembly protein [Thiohalorhabdus sp.]|uniref:pilus assembly protein n=1 Tax=Thiohalorhabdus sp. TaxID=3094134 RepID=UPI002FC2CBD5